MNDTLIIEAGRSARQYWHDLWRYRELFYVLSWRDMMIRYKQTVVGVLWAFLQPFIPAVITTILFSRVAHLASIPGVPYFLMVFCGMLPWQFFSSSLGNATQSVVGNSNLISKVYFPRLIVPASAVMTSLADFFVTLIPLFGAMAWAHVWPTWRTATLPLPGGAGAGAAAHGPECSISRLPASHPLHPPGRHLHLASDVLDRGRAGMAASDLCTQSHGGGDRRISLVHLWARLEF